MPDIIPNNTKWIPIVSDVELKKGGGSILYNAMQIYRIKTNRRIINKLSDKVGTVAYESDDVILCAKNYIYGYIVSCHKAIVTRAIQTNKQLYMYIADKDSFYSFNPVDILADGIVNHRGQTEMINFKIGFGTRVLKN